MRTDIPQEFLDAIEDGSRWRGHYLVFHWPDGDQGISDVAGIQYAPGLYCDALVAEWGTLTDSVDVEAAISGTGSQTRQFTVTLANTSETGWWCSRFADHPPENMEVDLYQAVDGATSVLIGRFVVQSPIEDDEVSGVVQLTMLSVNQAADPYVGTLDPVNNKHYPLIIGAMSGVPGTPYGAHPLAKLDGDVAAGATTIKCDRDLTAAGFPASGLIIIDFDTISYTGRSGVNFTGCSGVAGTHDSGQYVFISGHEYLFAFGAGPFDFAGPVYIDGEIYTGQHTIYNSRNPVQVGFADGYPWTDETDVITEETHPESPVGWSLSSDVNFFDGSNFLGFSDITDDLRTRLTAQQQFDPPAQSDVDYKFYSVLINLSAFCHGYGPVYGQMKLYYGGDRIGNWNAQYVDVTISYQEEMHTLASIEIEAHSWYPNPRGTTGARTNVRIYDSSVFIWTWKKYRKEYFSDLSLNIGQPGQAANPSDLIAALLAKQGHSSNIDSASFAACKAWFAGNGYSIAGFMDGGKRCSEAIKDVCWQSRSYLVWDADKVFLRIRYPVSISQVSYSSLAGNRRENSIRRRRQDFTLGAKLLGGTERQDSVINALTVRYQQDIEGNFGARVDVTRQDSIDKIGRAEGIKDAYLVQDAAYAAALADFWIAEICWPQSIISFKAAVKDGLLLLQLGDAVELHTDWSNIGVFKGAVMSLARTLGQAAPEPRANEWEVTIAGVQASA